MKAKYGDSIAGRSHGAGALDWLSRNRAFVDAVQAKAPEDFGDMEPGTPGGRQSSLRDQAQSEKRRLSTRFVAWLMGWLEPADLRCFTATESTDSERLEMASCQLKPLSRSGS